MKLFQIILLFATLYISTLTAPAQIENDPLAELVLKDAQNNGDESWQVPAFIKLSNNGDIRASLWLARIYDLGSYDADKDPAKAQRYGKASFERVLQLAATGDTESQFLIGACHHLGTYVKLDYSKAASWYAKAAKKKHVFAMNNLGNLYTDGNGVKPDIQTARRLFSASANLGSHNGKSNLRKYRPAHENTPPSRIIALKAIPAVGALGQSLSDGLIFLRNKKVIKNTTDFEKSKYENVQLYYFYNEGICIHYEPSIKRITRIEARSPQFDEYPGYSQIMPFELLWTDTLKDIEWVLGKEIREYYTLAYAMENVHFMAFFERGSKSTLQRWQVKERWVEE